jgi:hypothetical protein
MRAAGTPAVVMETVRKRMKGKRLRVEWNGRLAQLWKKMEAIG